MKPIDEGKDRSNEPSDDASGTEERAPDVAERAPGEASSAPLSDAMKVPRDWAETFWQSLPAPGYVVNRRGILVHVTEHCARVVFGSSIQRVLGKSLSDLFPAPVAERLWKNDLEVLAEGRLLEFEEVMPHADDGRDHTYLSKRFPLRDEKESICGVAAICCEITERKRIELRTESLLHEKTLLLAELRHRVKNNLQVMASLLRLQANKTSNEEALASLTSVGTRIEAMASLYDMLQLSGSDDRISLSAYLTALLDKLRRIQTDPTKVELRGNFEDVQLCIDDASPLGLIVNELASNALKHAFPGDRRGAVDVEVRSVGEKGMRLTVSDNGVGLADPSAFRSSKSLGFQLVLSLVEFQLKGTLQTSGNGGTTATVDFSPR